MGRTPCCDKTKVKRGPWSPEEDSTLKNYVYTHGTGGNWIALPHKAGLKRCGKSCRLRWLNYLRPDIKHGGFTDEEDNIILTLYLNIGSRWSVIASHLQGRTDNDVKNYWNTKMKKKLLMAQQRITATSLNVSNSNSAILPKAELVNYNENMEYSTSTTASPYRPMAVMKYQEQVSGSNPVSSIPRLMEEELVKENDTTTSTSTSTPFTSVSSSQGNTPILSPSFSLENSDYATWSGINIGDADAGELGFLDNLNYFQEEISEFGHVTNSNYSSWLANFSGHNSAQ